MRKLALDVLHEWGKGLDYASQLIDEASADCRLEPRNAGLLQTLVLGTVRHLSLLDYWAGQLTEGRELDRETRDALRLGLVQLLVLDMAPHAAVNETVEHAGRAGALVNAVLRRVTRERDALLAKRDTLPLHIRFSHPEWLVNRWVYQLGADATLALLEWNQQPAPIYARLNTLVSKRPIFPFTEDRGDGFYRVESVPRDFLESGACYIQDPSTGLAPTLLGVTPSHAVLDVCAAPGGKTAMLAQMMQNNGRIIATDSSAKRTKRLTENLARLKVINTTPVLHDWLEKPEGPVLNKRFDRILVDVPCSNTGVMRRRVDVRWRLKEEDFAALAETQFQLLFTSVNVLKPGGVVVYSTCSIDVDENEKIIDRMMKENPRLRLIEKKQLLPHRDAVDGAFAAKLQLGE
jgi:16S rRNA (cytosine967-C5)-methyltransferase